MRVEMEIPAADVQVGDIIVAWSDGRAGGGWFGTANQYEVSRVTPTEIFHAVPGGGEDHCCDIRPGLRLRVRREAALFTTQPVVNATVTVPAGRKVPDWPLTCPKCGRPQSAVLLFSSYDCKHGCYGRKAPAHKAESWDFTWRGHHWRATRVAVLPAGHRGWWIGDAQDLAKAKDNPDLWAIHEWPLSWSYSSPGWTRNYGVSQEGEDNLLIELTEVP